jgi:hypothetical protein
MLKGSPLSSRHLWMVIIPNPTWLVKTYQDYHASTPYLGVCLILYVFVLVLFGYEALSLWHRLRRLQ